MNDKMERKIGIPRRGIYCDSAAADPRLGAALIVIGALFISTITVFATTDAVTIGVDEGEMPPNIVGDARDPVGDWSSFDLYSHFNTSWQEGNSGIWYVIEFLSTDCGHCWSEAEDMSEMHAHWSPKNVEFIGIAVDFEGNEKFTSTRAEIAAFQDKSSHSGCYGDSKNCNSRPGSAHNFIYVDDREQTHFNEWGLSGTPSIFILQPNGLIAWSGPNHPGVELSEALNSVIPSA